MTPRKTHIVTEAGSVPLNVYRMLQMYYALRVEVTTGLRHSRGSVMKLAQREFGCKKGTKVGVMKELAAMLLEEGLDVETRKVKE
jgi:hypothetical protein